MASQVAQDFHNRAMLQNKQFVALRIAQGTKSSSPHALMAKRLQPLYYSNPLPDNSSGSKNRPFGINKDESGRPDAMMLVAMRQQQGGSNGVMHGGVLRDYKYAQKILQRRKTDVLNIEAAKAALPPVMPSLLEFPEVDLLSLKLNSSIQKVLDDVEDGRVDGYTISALKSIHLQLVQLLPTFDENRLIKLQTIFNNISQDIMNSSGTTVTANKAFTAMRRFINNKISPFITQIIKLYKQVETSEPRYVTRINPETNQPERVQEGFLATSSDPNRQVQLREQIIKLAIQYFGDIEEIQNYVEEEPEPPVEEEMRIRLPAQDVYSGEFAQPAAPVRRRPGVVPEEAPTPAPVEEEAEGPTDADEAAERVAIKKKIKEYVQGAYVAEDGQEFLERFYDLVIPPPRGRARKNKPDTPGGLKRSIFVKLDKVFDIDTLAEYLRAIVEEDV